MNTDDKTSIFVLIDALGWPCTGMHRYTLDDLPYRKPLTTLWGCSSGDIPTILTGICNFRRFPIFIPGWPRPQE